jgi:hypothetical protein
VARVRRVRTQRAAHSAASRAGDSRRFDAPAVTRASIRSTESRADSVTAGWRRVGEVPCLLARQVATRLIHIVVSAIVDTLRQRHGQRKTGLVQRVPTVYTIFGKRRDAIKVPFFNGTGVRWECGRLETRIGAAVAGSVISALAAPRRLRLGASEPLHGEGAPDPHRRPVQRLPGRVSTTRRRAIRDVVLSRPVRHVPPGRARGRSRSPPSWWRRRSGAHQSRRTQRCAARLDARGRRGACEAWPIGGRARVAPPNASELGAAWRR